jgi:hypothetical protein
MDVVFLLLSQIMIKFYTFGMPKNIIIFISSTHLMYHFISRKQPFLTKQFSTTFQL